MLVSHVRRDVYIATCIMRAYKLIRLGPNPSKNYLEPLYQHGLTLIPVWISKYIHYTVWGEITFPFPNFNGATVEP